METDPTEMSISGEKHPTLAELRDTSHPNIAKHLDSCSMCRSVVQADEQYGGGGSVPIQLDLPKGLVNESVFRWPVDPIARGGMAAIFAGEDKRLGRTVILKAPREGDDLPAGMNEMFQRRVTAEARILAKLQHPAIVTIYELGKTTVGWPFCVLEKVEGTSLRDRLDELEKAEKTGEKRTRERLELLSNLVSIAEALAYAHERRVVHRDVTPNNILLGKRGEATLIDWGIARDLDAPGGSATSDALVINDQEPSMSGRMVTISAGTPPYLPLEQTQGRSADPTFDVYSFGVTLYEVVSGRTPFEWKIVEGSERNRQINRFLDWLKSDDPVAPAMPRDPELSGIIARAMARNAEDRFTADELVRALKQYLTGDLVFSHRYSLTGRLARWASRHRAATVALVALIGFAVAGVLVYGMLSRSWAQQAEAKTQQAEAEKKKAEAEQLALAAQKDAADREKDAAKAEKEAEDADARAEKAKREGKNADALRRAADEKRRNAESKRKSAEDAAKQAKGTAEEATKRFQEAMKQKDEAVARADESDRQRDAALSAQANAEKERDAANAAKASAERLEALAQKERDTAKTEKADADKARDAAEKAREGAEKSRESAEKERDAAVATRNAAEKERDAARAKVAELEQKLREQPPAPRPPSPDQPPPSP